MSEGLVMSESIVMSESVVTLDPIPFNAGVGRQRQRRLERAHEQTLPGHFMKRQA